MTDHDAYVPASYWEDLLGGQFDESGVAYPEVAASFNRAVYRAQLDVVGAVVRRHGITPGAVLDIGCGTGIWVRFWQQHGAARVTGIDLTEASVRRLRDRFPGVTFVQRDIADAADVDIDPVDAVSAMSVLLHITDAGAFDRAVANVAAFVRPGGWVVLLEPAVVHRWRGPAFGPHSNSEARTVERWRAVLAAHGLELVDVRPVTVLLANPCDARTQLGWNVLDLWWRGIRKLVGRRERVGAVVGPIVLAVDRVVRRVARTGPSTKCLVARKPLGGQSSTS